MEDFDSVPQDDAPIETNERKPMDFGTIDAHARSHRDELLENARAVMPVLIGQWEATEAQLTDNACGDRMDPVKAAFDFAGLMLDEADDRAAAYRAKLLLERTAILEKAES